MAAVSIDFQLAAMREPISDCGLLGLEFHLVAKSLQPSDQFLLCLLAVLSVKIVTAQLVVFGSFAQYVPSRLQNCPRNRDDGPFFPASHCNPPIHCPQISIFPARCSPSGFHQRSAQPPISFRRFPTPILFRRFITTRTQPGP